MHDAEVRLDKEKIDKEKKVRELERKAKMDLAAKVFSEDGFDICRNKNR